MTDVALGGGPRGESPGSAGLTEFTTIGGYRLVQQLGEGGMGVVHLALDRSGRAVAIKVLRPHVAADPAARTRLAREVETLSRIRHPNVAGIIDHDVEGPRPFIVTRYIAGPSLDQVVDAHGKLSGPALLQLGRGLAQALHAIHGAGVVHRDVKPGNVLLLDGEPVLIDFGIAHIADDERLTRTGLVMGTPGYLSPEIIEGAEVSESTDWWGWAVTLGFAAAGRAPFGRGSMEAVLARVVRGDADLTGVDPGLVPLLDAALSPYPEDRPTDGEILTALETYAEGGQVTDVLRAVPRREDPPAGPAATRPIPPAPTAVLPPVEAARAARPTTYPIPGSVRPAAEPARAARPAYPPPNGPGALDPVPPPQALVPGPPRPPMAGDPRIGRAMRTGTLAALGLLLVVVGAAYPVLAVTLALLWSVVARTAERSVTATVLRRHHRGVRPGDSARAIAAGPLHLVTGLVAAAAAAIVPAIVGCGGLFAALLVLRALTHLGERTTYQIALAAGMLLAIVSAWWGPGGTGLRRGSRSLARGIAPTPGAAQFSAGIFIAVAAGLVLFMRLRTGMPIWTPWTQPPGILSSLDLTG
ncbi:MAG: protein kinase [Tetrasphaera sp.]|nr:protein kinase [Tetrasphaera sp.]